MEIYKTRFCVERLNITSMPELRKVIHKFKLWEIVKDGKTGVLWSTELQRVGHDLVTE